MAHGMMVVEKLLLAGMVMAFVVIMGNTDLLRMSVILTTPLVMVVAMVVVVVETFGHGTKHARVLELNHRVLGVFQIQFGIRERITVIQKKFVLKGILVVLLTFVMLGVTKVAITGDVALRCIKQGVVLMVARMNLDV